MANKRHTTLYVGNQPAPASAYKEPRRVSKFQAMRAEEHAIECAKIRGTYDGIAVCDDRWARRWQFWHFAAMRQWWALRGVTAALQA